MLMSFIVPRVMLQPSQFKSLWVTWILLYLEWLRLYRVPSCAHRTCWCIRFRQSASLSCRLSTPAASLLTTRFGFRWALCSFRFIIPDRVLHGLCQQTHRRRGIYTRACPGGKASNGIHWFCNNFSKSAYFLNLTKTDVRPCIFIHKHPVRQVWVYPFYLLLRFY